MVPGVPIEPYRVGERMLGVEPSQRQACVRDRGSVAAPTVTRRTRDRPGALRPDLERAAGIDARDAPAAGAHRLDQDGGQRKGKPRDRSAAVAERGPAGHEARVGTRATHVERQQVPETY